MDLDGLEEKTKEMSGKQLADVLVEVAEFKHGEPFVRELLCDLQDREDLGELYDDERLTAYF